MKNAKHIGRVGALAVALGIGAAVVTSPPVVVAEPASGSQDATAAASPDTESPSMDDSTTTDTKTGLTVGAPHEETRVSGIPEADEEESTEADDEEDADDEQEEAKEAAGDETAHAEDDADESALAGGESTPTQPTTLPEPVGPATDPAGTASEPSDNQGITTTRFERSVAAFATTDESGADDTVDPSATEPALAVVPTEVVRIAGGDSRAAPVSSVIVSQPVSAAQVAPVRPVGVVSGLVSGLLGWVGLGPSLTGGPVAPAEPPLLWGLLEYARRLVRHTFFNQSPTIGYEPTETTETADGVITGNLRAVDPDGDPLTFTVIAGPQYGDVVINRDGTFTYTPGAEFSRVGTDTFTFVVDDGAAYRLPGPVGRLLDSLHRVAQVLGFSEADAIASSPVVTAKPKVIATIDVGGILARGVAVTPDSATAYVTSTNTVSVIDTATNAITTVIPVPLVIGVAINPNGTTAYVVQTAGGGSAGSVLVIDTATNLVTDTITVGRDPRVVAVNPTGTRAYVTNVFDGTVSVINTGTGAVVATVAVGDSPDSVAVSPTAARAYVTNREDDTVSVINTATNSVIATIAVGTNPRGLAVSPNGALVYVANVIDSTVSVINTATNTVTATIAVGASPTGVAFNPAGTRAFVANAGDGVANGTVSMVNTATTAVIATINVGFYPNGGIAVSPDGDRLYVTNQNEGTVSVIGL